MEDIARFLQSPEKRSLLDLFLERSASAEGKGVYLTDDRRRYLDLAAIAALIGESSADLIDELISKKILYRGFIFACRYCRNSAWFSVAEVTQDFKCRRCNRTQVYTKANWKKPEEPAWFYKLDELVYQGYRQGMAVSLLALNYLRLESSENFSFATDHEFWKPGAAKPDAEVDLFCVSDGVLTIGEAKKEGRLGGSVSEENAEIAKYKRFAKSLAARRLIFATLEQEWKTSTVTRLTEAFQDTPYVSVNFLTAKHLQVS